MSENWHILIFTLLLAVVVVFGLWQRQAYPEEPQQVAMQPADWQRNAAGNLELLYKLGKGKQKWFSFGVFHYAREAHVCEDDGMRKVIAVEYFITSSDPIPTRRPIQRDEFQDVPVCSKNQLYPTIGGCK